MLAILPHHRAELRSCAHIASRLVDALENTRSVWVIEPSAWMTRCRWAALAHCWRATRPWRLVWARFSRRAARKPPITRGWAIRRAATRSASPMKAAKRVEGISLIMVLGAGGGGGLSPSLERILQHRGRLSRVCSQNRDSAPGGTRSRVGGGAVLD